MSESEKHHILLAVVGLSPQVITETIYAQFKRGDPVPDRVIVITTMRGAEETQKHLLQEKKLAQLCHDYQLNDIQLDQEDICVVHDLFGKPMDDATSQNDHIVMSNFICEKVRQLTANDDYAIHASIAGGRKTMTFLLGYAMSLYGRKQDKLSHILVTVGFESSEFFYPTPYSQQIYLRSGSKDAKDAEVTLADIPFVRMREEVPEKLLNGSASYSDTVTWLNTDLEKENIVLDVNNRLVLFCGQRCQLPPADFVFYWWFLLRAKAELSGLSIPHLVAPEPSYADEFLIIYQKSTDYIKAEEVAKMNFQQGMDKRYFEERKSGVNTNLKKQFGKRIGGYLQINQLGKVNRRMTFGITFPSSNILIKD